MRLAEIADDRGGVPLFRIHQIVEMAHVRAGDFAPEFRKHAAKLRKLFQHGLANDRYSIVGRKIVAVVFKDNQMQRIDDPVGGIARHDVDFMVLQRPVNQPQIHHARLLREMQAVTFAPTAEAVGAFENGKPTPTRHWGAYGTMSEVLRKMQALRIVTANDHRKGIFEAQRLGDRQSENVPRIAVERDAKPQPNRRSAFHLKRR